MGAKLIAEVGFDGSGLKKGLDAIRGQITSLGSMIAGAFTVGAIAGLARETIAYAGHITDLSDRLGLSTDYLQEMQFVMKQNGASVDDLTAAFEKLGAARIAALSGDADKMENFKKFGINEEQLQHARPQEMMDQIAAQFKKLGNNDEIKTAFKDLGGRGAGALVPSFISGIEEGRADAKKSGHTISEDVVAQLDAVGDTTDRFKLQMMGTFAPAIIFVVDAIRNGATLIAAYASEFGAFWASFDIMKIIKSNFSVSGLKKGGAIGEIARQFGTATALGEEEFDRVIREDAVKKVDEEQAAANKRAMEKNKAAETPDYTPKEKKEKNQVHETKTRNFSDSALAVGNFLGAGRSGLESIAQKSLKIQEKMLSQLDRIANKKELTIKTP